MNTVTLDGLETIDDIRAKLGGIPASSILTAQMNFPEAKIEPVVKHKQKAYYKAEDVDRFVNWYRENQLMTWHDIRAELGGVSSSSLYAVQRNHEAARIKPVMEYKKKLYFTKEDANRFIAWYRANHRGGIATRVDPTTVDPSEIIVGYDGLFEYSLERTNGEFPITLNNAGFWQRKERARQAKRAHESTFVPVEQDGRRTDIVPDFYRKGPKGGRPKAHFLKSTVDAYLERRNKIDNG